MKRTYNINISGEPFVIDDDAYTMLNDYLDALSHAFAKYPDSRQICEDIEGRIAELLQLRLEEGAKVITIEDTQTVINRIGRPEEIIAVDEELTGNRSEPDGIPPVPDVETSEGSCPPPPFNPEDPENLGNIQPIKRLYRDTSDKVLGGVCSGMAHYFNIDPIWIRLIFVVLFLAGSSWFFIGGWSMFLVYILLWVIVPEARTPVEKLRMYGRATTMQNIGKVVTGDMAKKQESENPESQLSDEDGSQKSFAKSLTEIFGIIARVFMVCLGIVSVIIAIPLILALVVLLSSVIFPPLNEQLMNIMQAEGAPQGISWSLLAVTGISSIIMILVPCVAVIYCALSMLNKKWKLSRKAIWTTLVIWFISIMLSIAGGTSISLKVQDDTDRIVTYDIADENENDEDTTIEKNTVETRTVGRSDSTTTVEDNT